MSLYDVSLPRILAHVESFEFNEHLTINISLKKLHGKFKNNKEKEPAAWQLIEPIWVDKFPTNFSSTNTDTKTVVLLTFDRKFSDTSELELKYNCDKIKINWNDRNLTLCVCVE